MAFPDTPLSSTAQWGNLTDPALNIGRVKLSNEVTLNLNTLAARVVGMPQGIYDEDDGTGTVTLATLGANLQSAATSITVTTTGQRRFRVVASALFQSGTAIGMYHCVPAYNTGGSVVVASAIAIGNGGYCSTPATGTGGRVTTGADHSVLLAAGTYTFYPLVRRHAGGSATDTADIGYIAVYDEGSV